MRLYGAASNKEEVYFLYAHAAKEASESYEIFLSAKNYYSA